MFEISKREIVDTQSGRLRGWLIWGLLVVWGHFWELFFFSGIVGNQGTQKIEISYHFYLEKWLQALYWNNFDLGVLRRQIVDLNEFRTSERGENQNQVQKSTPFQKRPNSGLNHALLVGHNIFMFLHNSRWDNISTEMGVFIVQPC